MNPLRRPPIALAALLLTWLGLRVAFFEGLWGYDDLYHVNWAVHPRVPIDVWEARLLFNGLLWVGYQLFGFHEGSFALPTMIGSLLIGGSAMWAAHRAWGWNSALLAGALAAILAGDVIRASDPMANPLGAGFAAMGTAILVGARSRRERVLASILLGAGIHTHLATLFYVAPLALAWALHDRGRWIEALGILGVAGVSTLAFEALVFGVFAGDPMLHLNLIRKTHLEIQQYVIAPRLDDGSWNPDWFVWPLHTFVFSKDFGFSISLPVAIALLSWRSMAVNVRFLVLAVSLCWLWLNFGTQHPLAYAPLDHQTRYWHALALPAILLAVVVYQSIASKRARWAYLSVLVLPMPMLLLSSGPWGQNVEISRELLAHAASEPANRFATDPYTYDEMYVLNACEPPANVTVIAGFPEPEFHQPSPEARLSPDAPDLRVLYNPLNMGRVRTLEFDRFVHEALERRPVSPPAWRAIAWALPDAVRSRSGWFQRKPPGELATRRAGQ